MLKASIAALLFITSTTVANAVDLKDLLPCRSAAIRLCDRSQGMTTAALWRCGATLASRATEVGPRCQDVLKRYGQLQH
jgi:hypothetical protein